jgi:hypothetical protein
MVGFVIPGREIQRKSRVLKKMKRIVAKNYVYIENGNGRRIIVQIKSKPNHVALQPLSASSSLLISGENDPNSIKQGQR